MIDGLVLNIQPVVSPVSLELNFLTLNCLALRLVELQPIPPGNSSQSNIVWSREIDSKIRLLLQDPASQLSINHNISLLSLFHGLFIDQPIDCWVFKGRIPKVFKRDASIFGDSPEEYACRDMPQFETFRKLGGVSGFSSSVKTADGDYHAPDSTGRASWRIWEDRQLGHRTPAYGLVGTLNVAAFEPVLDETTPWSSVPQIEQVGLPLAFGEKWMVGLPEGSLSFLLLRLRVFCDGFNYLPPVSVGFSVNCWIPKRRDKGMPMAKLARKYQ